MAMLSLEQVAENLARKYWSNRGFIELCQPANYPYAISLSPPSSKFILENFAAVREWQRKLDQSEWSHLLQKEVINHRVLGQQKLAVKICFNSPNELEHFVHKFAAKRVKETMPYESWDDFGVTGSIQRGSFNAFYSLCQVLTQPLYPALAIDSEAFKLRLEGIRNFMLTKAQLCASLGYDFLIAMQFVDFMATLPHTPNLYLRQFALPHMHTKFIEQHYALLDQLFECCLPQHRDLFRKASDSSQLNTVVKSDSLVANNDTGQKFTQKYHNIPDFSQQDFSQKQHNPRDFTKQDFSQQDCDKKGLDGHKLDRQIFTRLTIVEQESDTLACQNTELLNDIEPDLDVLSELAEISYGISRPFHRFMLRWGFKLKPVMFRIRSLDPDLFWLDPSQGLSSEQCKMAELNVELACLEQWQPQSSLRHIIICENEICFLSLPKISNTIAIWGSGYKAAILGKLSLLDKVDVLYWGDLDTHGFAILNQLRQSHPNSIRSVFMDIEALEQNLHLKVEEKRQYQGALKFLTSLEQQAYQALLAGTYGQRVRIEQELISYDKTILKWQHMLSDETVTPPKMYQ